MDGVALPVRAVRWRRKVLMPPRLLSHSPRCDPKLGRGCRLDKVEVRWVIGGVMNGLPLNDAAIADEVREQANPVLGPAESS